jgi:Fe-S-cluster containining protein
MAGESEPAPESITATVGLNLSGTRLAAEMTVPTRSVELRVLLPAFRSLAEAIIAQSVENDVAQGLTISCRAGCGACCRQLVPISEAETRVLRELVEALPEPRRAVVLARFADARRRLEESGVLEKLLHPEGFSDEELRPMALEYFGLGIACPFLENESCSIYAERPISCREYLVTSPAENCARPSPETVRCVKLPAKVSTAIHRIGEDPKRRFVRWVPLILALEWTSPDELPPRSGPEWLREFFQRLTGRDVPPPPPAAAAPRTGDPSGGASDLA